MRRGLILVFAVLALGAVNGLILQKESILRSGQRMLLRLSPVDPRSLMQGDYMELNYEVASDSPVVALRWTRNSDGQLVVRIGENDVAEYVRLHEGEDLAENEHLLLYRRRGWTVRLGAESFFFQEGTASVYENAKYGELRVTESGNCVLVGLCDSEFRQITPDP